MNLQTIQSAWPSVRGSSSFSESQSFIQELLSLNSPEAVAYHFDLLKDRQNLDLNQELRAAFVKRGKEVEEFLVERANHDPDLVARGDALQLLGILRSAYAAPLARVFLASGEEELRHKAIIVLGWIGSEEDVEILADRATADPIARLRGFAATAMRQICLRIPTAKERIVSALMTAIVDETDPEALSLTIVSLQSIVTKSFGLRERLSDGTVSGDVDKAKAKAVAFLRARA